MFMKPKKIEQESLFVVRNTAKFGIKSTPSNIGSCITDINTDINILERSAPKWIKNNTQSQKQLFFL